MGLWCGVARLRAALLAPLMVLVCNVAHAQRRIRVDDPPLTLVLPRGFEPFAPEQTSAAVIGTFRRAPVGSQGPLVVQLLRLGAELPQRPLTADERAAFTLGAPFRFDDHPASIRALGHTLPMSAGYGQTPAGARVVRLAVLLPTRGHAVQVSVLARRDDSPAAQAVLSEMLRSAESEVSWRSAAQRAFFALATAAFALAVMGTLVIMVRVLLQGHVTHLGPLAQRRIALLTGASWAVFALWLLLPLRSAEWAAAAPTLALAVTFLAKGRSGA